MNQELPDVQAGFRKGRRTRDQIVNIHWIIEKEENSRKTFTSAFLTAAKPLTVWITTNWKILKEMGIPDHLTRLLRNVYAGREASWNQTSNNRQVPNWEKGMPRLYIVILLI